MEHVYITVLGLMSLLVFAVLMLPVANRLKIPYTVLLAAAGIGIGLISLKLGITADSSPDAGHGSALGDIFMGLHSFDITSEIVFFVFLPALVFESALAIDVRRLFNDLGPILMLAVVGLLLSTFAIGYTLSAVSSQGLIVCLLLGAIVSATDPVAVVAIFKTLGAPKRLAILVEGESLFNDATAIVMFTILAAMIIGGGDVGFASGIGSFLKVFVGGIVVGYIISRAACAVLARIDDLPLVEITLTIGLAYLSFLIAEHYLHVSGVMAVVTSALVMGSFGRTTISAGTWHSLIEIWEQLGFWANSLIFVLVGMAVPVIIDSFGWEEVRLLTILLVVGFTARAGIIYGLLPLFEASGLSSKVSRGYKAVMFWGGLRGAVSLALALSVMENPAYSQEVKQFIGVLVTGFVLFTLFVNATTVHLVLGLFGLNKLSPADQAIRDRSLDLALTTVEEAVQTAASDGQVEDSQIAEVNDYYKPLQESARAESSAIGNLTPEERTQIGLTIMIAQERKSYLRQFADGFVSPEIARILLARAEDVMDGAKSAGEDGVRAAVDRNLGFNWRFKLAMFLQRRLTIGKPLANLLAERFSVLRGSSAALKRVLADGSARMTAVLGDASSSRVFELLQERLDRTEQALAALKLQYPDYAADLQKRHLGHVALRVEHAEYKNLLDDSVISAEIYDNLNGQMNSREKELKRVPELDLGLEPEKLIANVPYFSELSPERISEIARLTVPQLALPGELIVRKGDVGDAMYFISSGAVSVNIGDEPVRLGSGNFFGEIALVTSQPRTADIVAEGFCSLLILNTRQFNELSVRNPEIRETIEEIAKQRLGG